MATNKTNSAVSSKKNSGTSTAKKTVSKSSSNGKKASKSKQRAEAELKLRRNKFIKSIICFVTTVLIFAVYVMPGEKLWLALHNFYWGLFGFTGIVIPFIVLYCAVQFAKDKPSYRFPLRAVLFFVINILFSSIIYSFSTFELNINNYGEEISRCYILGSEYSGTGLFGGLLGALLVKSLGSAGAGIIFIIVFIIISTIAFDSFIINIFDIFKKPVHNVSNRINENKEIRMRIREQEQKIKNERRKQEHEEYVQQKINKHMEKISAKNHKASKDFFSDFCRVDASPFYEPVKSTKNTDKNISQPLKQEKNSEKSVPDKNALSDSIVDDIPKDSENFEFVTEDNPSMFSNELPSDDIVDKKQEFDTNNEKQVSYSPIIEKAANTSTIKKQTSKVEPMDISIDDNNSIVEGQYVKPPVTLLEPQPEDDTQNISSELHHNASMLIDTLKSFGIQATIVNISRGPSVTRYELQPAAGVKISKITNLSDDIAMSLAATGVRIEAPIPGKSAVGIEVPNKNVSIVKMRNIIESPEFINAKSKLTVALGYDITGKITLADLGKMPHLLIAGSTGSGKSVCINSMLVSLLYKANPDEVKLMLIDPKVVELGVYNGIPHLIVPVVTDPRKAAGALNWAVNEMLERYKTFAEYNVRDMHSYNRLVDKQNAELEESETNTVDDSERSFEEDEMLAQAKSDIMNSDKSSSDDSQKLKKMPQIVIVIDELADLMMAAPNEVEESICRLAQMARAAGMHLVIATQRPSVDVITGLIKANVPSRIAFAVKSQIDSRTILDSGGAEKLLGRGDMLFSPIGKNKPIRVQGCYVDDSEIENIIEFIKKSKVVEYDDNVIEEIEKNAVAEPAKNSSGSDNDNVDPMMEQAIQCVVEAGQASTSLLQRRLRLGYARAGRLIDEMEQMGIVGPHEGSKPRQVLMSYQQWLERNMSRSDNN